LDLWNAAHHRRFEGAFNAKAAANQGNEETQNKEESRAAAAEETRTL